VNEFDGLTFECDEDEFKIVNNISFCRVTSGDQVIEALNFEKDRLWVNVGVLAGMYVIMVIIGLLITIFKFKKKK